MKILQNLFWHRRERKKIEAAQDRILEEMGWDAFKKNVQRAIKELKKEGTDGES